MSTANLLGILKHLGVKLWLENGVLRVRALPHVLTPELKAELSERKPDIVRLLQQLSLGSADKPIMPRRDTMVTVPLSFAQRRLWFLDQLEPGLPAYNNFNVGEIRQAVDMDVLERTVDEMVRRHEVLRTSLPSIDGEPVQRVAAYAKILQPMIDLSAMAEADQDAEVHRRVIAESKLPFDLFTGPLARIRLIKLSAERYLWLQSVHHIISDDWSLKVMEMEVNTLYAAFAANQPSPLPELPIQWGDFTLWQHDWLQGKVLDAHVEFWATHLGGTLPVLDLARNRARQRETRGGCGTFFFPPALSSALRKLCETRRITLFMALIAGYAGLLSRYTAQDDIIIGSAVSDRGRIQTENLIGFFLNTLPLRVRVDSQSTFHSVLDSVRDTCRSAFDYSAVPFEELMPRLELTRDTTGSPLFQTMLVLLNTPPVRRSASSFLMPTAEEDVIDISGFEGPFGDYRPYQGNGTTKFDLSLILEETPDGLRGRTEFNADLFDQAEIGKLVERFQIFLAAAIATPDQPLAELDLLTDVERREVLGEWVPGPSRAHAVSSLHQFVERQAFDQPSSVALEADGQALTYAELNREANQLAGALLARGVTPGARVGICLERSRAAMATLLGILKVGAVCVPLDPAIPSRRLAFIVEDATIELLLTEAHGNDGCAAALPIDVLHAEASRQPGHNLDLQEDSGRLAYVLYTSGSTGQPKGVMLSHGALVNYVEGAANEYGIAPGDRVLQFASLAFDASLEEIFSTFAHGATLVLREEGMLESSGHFMDRCRALDTTVLMLPTAYWHELASDIDTIAVPAGLHCVVIGGERASPVAVARWQAAVPAHVALYNTYGPTEGAIAATRYKCPGHAAPDLQLREVSLGRPVSNAEVYILDGDRRLVPPYMQGEIYLGGEGVANGYLNLPGLTAERFVDNPFDPPGRRLYRTGDLARYDASGQIEYLGRNDAQVKIRGFRIELGEIEARLSACTGVSACAVVVREDVPGEKRVVAYVRPDPAASASAASWRGALAAELPDYMVPVGFVTLDEFPLTVNGKLDMKALAPPDASATASQAFEAPVGPAESAIAGIWKELLGLERVGRHDNFFQLGGHSLLAVRLMARMRQVELHADVRTLFMTPTLMALAAAAGHGTETVEVPPNLIPGGATVITPGMLTLVRLTEADIERIAGTVDGGIPNIQDIYPLAPMQEGMLFHYMMAAEGDPYQVRGLASFDSREQLDRYLEALQFSIIRHDMLRTSIAWEGLSEPVQVVWRTAPLQVSEVELPVDERDVADALWERFDASRYRLDLRQAPLLRVFIARDDSTNRWVALQVMHHLCMDNTAQEVLKAEISVYLDGGADRLSPALAYRDFVAQARLGVDVAEHEAFFREMLGDVDEPTMPYGLADVRGDGSDIIESRHGVDAGLSQRLRAKSRGLGVSTASLFYLAWAQVLARVSGRNDVVFGTVLFGRMQGGNVLGLGINTLPIRVHIDQAPVDAKVRSVHSQLSRLLRHEHASLALAQRCSGVPAATPLFSALLNYRHSATGAEGVGAGQPDGLVRLRSEERTNYPLTLAVDDFGDGFDLLVQAQNPVRPGHVCTMMHRALEELVAALEEAPSRPVAELDVLSLEERRQVVKAFNHTAVDYPHGTCLHQMFEAQARLTPDAEALAFVGTTWTYAGLDRAANRVAHALRLLGVVPDSRVALFVERSPAMVIGMLGILKAGGCYVPLDPDYPVDRIEYMLFDCAPVAVLTQAACTDRLPESDALIIDLDAYVAEGAANDPFSAPEALSDRSAAYVIYTSGSTGMPKGVIIEHAGIVNRLRWMQDAYALTGVDRVLQKTPYSFDVSVWEFFWPLSYGATLVLAEPGGHKDPAYLRQAIERERISVLHFVPAMLRHFLDTERFSQCNALRDVFCSGEALPVDLARDFLASCSARLHNLYGPTEASVDVTYHACERGWVNSTVPIGRPIANTQIYILNEQLLPAPIGVSGELYIGGIGVARGYLNRPDLTAERFIDDPFGPPGARLYRTGDLARYDAEGSIDYLGRNDFQVKVRGFRIELGEIEARVAGCPGVAACVVTAREDSSGDKRLVAYLRTLDGATVTAADLRTTLSRHLPEYMVPSAFVTLDAFPVSINGKLDRKALPSPDAEDLATQSFEAAVGDMESSIASIWQEVIGLKRVGRHDNFFELGGHSLLATRMISRINDAFAISMPLRRLFEAPTIAELAVVAAGLASNERGQEGDLAPGMAQMVAGLEHLTDAEIEALLGEENDPGLDYLR